MRYWTGAEVNYAFDAAPAVIVTGAPETRVVVPGNIWHVESVRWDGAKIWRLVTPGTLVRTQRPINDSLSEVLIHTLSSMKTSGLHPALKNGLEGEAKRLYPEIDGQVVGAVKTFVDFLRAKFGLEEQIKHHTALVPFVDDFGPEMLTFINDRATVLPEIPPVYDAPESWRRTQWWVSNHMVGPALFPEIPLEEKISFPSLTTAGTTPPHIEGLVYFHALRVCLAGDAWRQTPDAPLTKGLIHILMEAGQRPWQTRRG